jgi:hypothetical protein
VSLILAGAKALAPTIDAPLPAVPAPPTHSPLYTTDEEAEQPKDHADHEDVPEHVRREAEATEDGQQQQ